MYIQKKGEGKKTCFLSPNYHNKNSHLIEKNVFFKSIKDIIYLLSLSLNNKLRGNLHIKIVTDFIFLKYEHLFLTPEYKSETSN